MHPHLLKAVPTVASLQTHFHVAWSENQRIRDGKEKCQKFCKFNSKSHLCKMHILYCSYFIASPTLHEVS